MRVRVLGLAGLGAMAIAAFSCARGASETGDLPPGDAGGNGGTAGAPVTTSSGGEGGVPTSSGGMGGMPGTGGAGTSSSAASSSASASSSSSASSSAASSGSGGSCSGLQCGPVCCTDPTQQFTLCCPTSGDCGVVVGFLCVCTDGC